MRDTHSSFFAMINIIAVGNLKDKWIKEGCGEYAKRLGSWGGLTVTECAEQRLPDDPSQAQIDAALEKEGRDILSRIKGDSAVIALCIEGELLSSEELSGKLDSFMQHGKSTIYVIIGSSYGLSDTVKKRADLRLSMSRMTFPHRLARVMICEQLYRAMSISHGTKYHK